jgi:hypothetical protein
MYGRRGRGSVHPVRRGELLRRLHSLHGERGLRESSELRAELRRRSRLYQQLRDAVADRGWPPRYPLVLPRDEVSHLQRARRRRSLWLLRRRVQRGAVVQRTVVHEVLCPVDGLRRTRSRRGKRAGPPERVYRDQHRERMRSGLRRGLRLRLVSRRFLLCHHLIRRGLRPYMRGATRRGSRLKPHVRRQVVPCHSENSDSGDRPNRSCSTTKPSPTMRTRLEWRYSMARLPRVSIGIE